MMTDNQWLECADLDLLIERMYAKNLVRKRYLFCAACCRRIWALIADVRCRLAIEKVVQYADGLVTKEHLELVDMEIKLVGNDTFQAYVADKCKSAVTSAAFHSACAT